MIPEPTLLDCAPMTQTDHKKHTMKLYCVKHGTVVYETEINSDWTRELLLSLWRNRECKDL